MKVQLIVEREEAPMTLFRLDASIRTEGSDGRRAHRLGRELAHAAIEIAPKDA